MVGFLFLGFCFLFPYFGALFYWMEHGSIVDSDECFFFHRETYIQTYAHECAYMSLIGCLFDLAELRSSPNGTNLFKGSRLDQVDVTIV